MWELIFTNDRIVFFFIYSASDIINYYIQFFFFKFDFQNVNVSRTDTQGMLYSFFNDYFHFGQIHKLKLIEDIDD